MGRGAAPKATPAAVARTPTAARTRVPTVLASVTRTRRDMRCAGRTRSLCEELLRVGAAEGPNGIFGDRGELAARAVLLGQRLRLARAVHREEGHILGVQRLRAEVLHDGVRRRAAEGGYLGHDGHLSLPPAHAGIERVSLHG